MKLQFKKPMALSFAIACAAFTTNTLAAGFQINEHSAVSLGRALAGEAAIAENASALSHNPALASFFEGAHLSAGLSYIVPDINADGTTSNALFQAASGGRVGGPQPANADDVAPSAFVPNAYYLRPINDQLSFGLALNSHFGLSTEYGDDFVASDIANFAEVITININPSMSFKVNERLALGLGVSLVHAEGHIHTTFANYQDATLDGVAAQVNALRTGQGLDPISLDNEDVLDLQGDDWAFGFNAGLAWQATDDITLGLSYRSKVSLELEGDVSTDLNQVAQLATVPGLEGLAGLAAADALNDSASLSIDLPAISQAAIAWDITDALMLSASAHLIEWSSVQDLTVMVPRIPNGREIERLEWDDTWRFGLAAAYKVSDDITVRAGYAVDESPTNDEHRTLAIPDGDRNWLSLGATWAFADNMSVDAGYAYINGDQSPVSQFNPTTTTRFEGQSGGDASVFAVSFNYAL